LRIKQHVGYILLAAALYCAVASSLFGGTLRVLENEGTSVTTDSLFYVGEELVYNVSYGSFDIGQIRIVLTERTMEAGKSVYKAVAHIDSYKNIPFVNLHTLYESAIDENVFSHWFRSRTKKDNTWNYATYDFRYADKKLYIERGKENVKSFEKRDTLSLDTSYQDGLSVFYFARANVLRRQEVRVPTIVNESRGDTRINFTVEHTHEKIDAVNYPVDLVHFEGEAKFIGIFGLTGSFEGWFSNDDARIPVIATMKVLIGNVRIELMKWKRNNWNPPRFMKEHVK
jgi:hypothetical protein